MFSSLLLVLVNSPACTNGGQTDLDDTAPDTASDTGASPPETWHALLTADGLLSKDNPPLVEVDANLDRVWTYEFDGLEGRGAQGVDRNADGQTVYTRVLGGNSGGWIDLINPNGTVAWSWEGDSVGGLSFPHGVIYTPAGDLVIADTSAGRLLSVDLAGQVLWEEPVSNAAPNGLATWTDSEGETYLAVTGRHSLVLDAEDEEIVNRYRLNGRTEAPDLEWSRVLPLVDGHVESPHGPTFLDDGSIVYCARALHQMVRLSPDGDETWRSPLDLQVLSQPQGAAWVEGALLIADSSAGQLLRFDDPFGAFENTAATPLDGIFGVKIVWCGPNEGLPCL
jgi:hypothetical protein